VLALGLVGEGKRVGPLESKFKRAGEQHQRRKTMRLSDAMATGRVTIDKLEAAKLSGCILGMACNAVGIKTNLQRYPYPQIMKKWPWLKGQTECRACGHGHGTTDFMHAIWHQFDSLVMYERPSMTVDELIDWVRSVEPAEEVSEPLQLADVDVAVKATSF
jgi:hypothetical protein